VAELTRLAEAVIKSRKPRVSTYRDGQPATSGGEPIVQVDGDALQLLEDWIVNRFGEE
jgi:hypothetical protein